MKLSELIKQNAEDYIQIQGNLDDGPSWNRSTGVCNGKRSCCVIGMLGWVLFPDEMEGGYINIVPDEDDEGVQSNDLGEDSDGLMWAVMEKVGVKHEDITACLPEYGSLISANDAGLPFLVIAERLESCGL